MNENRHRAATVAGAVCLMAGFGFAAVPAQAGELRDQDPRPSAENSRPNGYYTNCAQAKLDGEVQPRRGDPGYWSYLDGDGDGIACEYGDD
ncbi:excalibur calcium-binding domain-containing protein [Nocardia sp. NPDC127579]|uniref:excalibur calcium-binding domain-containing protein n=1 Tax=Nocardia sp. NPDC127579 TaxID=3345402 RepID=UPI00363F8BB3